MAGKTANTAIRLGIEGDAEVKRALNAIGESGDAAAQRLAKSFARADADVEAALARREKQAAKIAAIMPQTAMQMRIDGAAGTGFGEWEGSAKRSAAAFAGLLAEQERMEARTRALIAVIDPASVAQDRFNAEVAEASALLAAGRISQDQYQAAVRRSTLALNETAKGSSNARQAMAGASYQVQDLVTQISMGANPITAFVVQSGQLAGQFMNVEGKAGAVARFLMGPWGLGIQVAMMALAPFVGKLFEGSDAAEKQADALKKHREAVLALAEAQGRALLTAERKQALDVAQIKIDLDGAIAARQKAQAQMEAARSGLLALSQPGVANERGVGFQRAEAQAEIDRLNRQIADGAVRLATLQAGVNAGFARMVGQRVDAMRDPRAGIELAYSRIRSDLENNPELQRNTRLLARKLDALADARDRELKAVEASTKALTRDAETLTANQVAKMLRGELSDVQITSTTGGRHAKNSYHYRNQAVDFVPAGGMSSMTKDDVRRIFESRGIQIVELLGPGDKGHSDHFHVAWTKGKHALDDFTDAAKRAKEEADELTKLRIFSQSDELFQGFQEVLRSREEAARRYQQGVRDLVGDGDPLAGVLDEGKDAQRREVDAWNVENARRLEKQRGDIQNLSGLYRTMFTSGTKGVWDTFKQMGLQVLSELLARWAVLGTIKGAFGGEDGIDTGIFGTIFRLGGKGGGSLTGEGGGYADVLGTLFGGRGRMAFASGTEYAAGGTALVGEFGKELVNLPRGSRVTSAAETRRLFAGNDNGASPRVVQHFSFSGNMMTPEFWAQVQAQADGAAIRGAAGGAAMADAEARGRGMRRLGRSW